MWGEGPRGGDGERPNQKSKVERGKRGKGKLKTFHFGRKGTRRWQLLILLLLLSKKGPG